MDAVKKDLLEESYDRIINVGLCIVPYEDLSDIAAPEVMLFGTTKDEKLFSFRDLDAMFKSQYEQMDGFVPSLDRKRLFTRTSNDGNNAFITEEVILTITSPEEVNTIFIRCSCVMEYIDNQWKLTHWHASTPVDTENDHWHQEEWKREKEKLQKLVDEQTADLHGKNKELEIEASIERVRAVAMSMNKPEDMLRVCRVISDQLQQFGVEHIRNVQTVIINEEKGTYHNYQYFTPYKTESVELTECDKNPVVYEMVTRMLESADAFFTTNLTGDELATFRSYRKQENQFPDPLLDETESIDGHFFSIGPGGLGITLYRPLNKEGLKIFKRFHNVFSLAYRRFRDIEKAEAQAREAKIELSLERIRAQATAMQESSDLLDIVVTMRTEFINLGHEAHYFWHMRWLPELYEKAMTSGDGSRIGMVMTLPRHIHGDIAPLAAWEKGNELTYVLAMDVDTAVDYVDKMITLGDFEQVDPQAPTLDDIRHIGGLTFIMARTTHGEIGYSLPGVVPDPPKEAVDTLVRFAGVFDLAYKRFEDLKRAEAQARETKIELALERVRARTMAMQKSEELAEVAFVLFEKLRELGADLWGTGFGLCDKTSDKDSFWFANENGVFPPVAIPNTTDPAHSKMYEGWKAGKDFLALEASGKKLKSHYDYMLSLQEVKPFFQKILDEGLSLPEWQQWNAAYFKHGYLLIITLEPYPDPDILVRFAGVFDQTYTRFLDLKNAEAQAKEANIQLALERVRAKTMAMKTQGDLLGIIELFGDQLKAVDVRFDDVTIIDGPITKNRDWELWSFVPEAENLSHKILIPYTETPYFTKTAKAVEEYEKTGNPIQVKSFTKKEKDEFIDHYRKYAPGVIDEVSDLVYANPGSVIVDAFLEEVTVSLVRWDLEPYTEEELEIFDRFAKEFRRTYIRFLDIIKAEEQARESEIQLALERVRAKSMAMHKSDELADLSMVLVQQVQALGIETWFCAFNIYDDHPEGSIEWGSNGQGTFPRYRTPREGVFLDYYEAGQRGETLLINEIGEDECPAHYDYLCSLPGVGEQLLQMKDEGIPFPVYQIDHAAFFRYGYILFITFEPVPEAHDIFKRFAKVFQQTYTRFLDLQKSEEQAREAKIEAALERVRARSMGMHKSDDLIDVVREIGKGIHELGIQLHYSQIYTDYTYDLKTGLNIWVDVEGQDYLEKFHIPYIDHSITLNYYNALNEGLDYFSDHFSKAGKDSYFKLLFKYSDLKRIPQKRKELILDASGWTRFTVILTEASLNFGRYSLDEFTDEEHEIFIRFAKVFGQAYTRFLDLEKAEAQAREAEIEAALERVRSRSLAMHKTDELQDVVRVVAEELKNTGVILDTGGAVICTYFQDSKDVIHWTATEDPAHPSVPYFLPYFEDELFDEAWESKSRGDDYFAKEFSFEVKNNFWEYAFEHSDYRQLPNEYKKIILESKSHGIAWAWSENSAIMIPSIQGDLPSEEEKKTLIRFAKVFEQSFIRFLDLQKAEDQAREAKIEAALEKVRSRTMGMQSSDELPEVANLLFLEIQALGIPAWSCGYNILNDDKKSAAAWMSSEGTLQEPFKLRLFGETSFDEMGEFVFSNEPMLVQELDGKELEEHYTHMKSFPDLHPTFENIETQGLSLPTYQINHLCKFSHGFLLFITYEPVPDAHDIFKRFTNVFDQTYTRFLDLEKAEAQAREARIETALEKVRSRSLAMHNSDELNEVVKVLFEKMTELDVPSTAIAIQTFTEGSKDIQCFVCGDVGTGIVINQYLLPYFDHPIVNDFHKVRKKNLDVYVGNYTKKEKDSLYEIVLKLPELKDLPAEVSTTIRESEIYEITMVPAKKSVLAVNDFHGNPLSESQINILKRFTKVFDQAYIRFLDLQNVEEKAIESQIEAALERVRSRSMGMQKSSELRDVVDTLYGEFIQLGLVFNNVVIQLLPDDSKDFHMWITSEDGLYQDIIHWPYVDIPVFNECYRARLGKKDVNYITQSEAEVREYFEEYFKLEAAPQERKAATAQVKRINNMGTYQEHAGVFLMRYTEGEFSEKDKEIVRRFSKVFDQTYTRFLDLQKAEAQAREARIGNALEKVRSRSLAMQSPHELIEVAQLLREEMGTLGVEELETSSIFILDDSSGKAQCWFTTKDADNPVKSVSDQSTINLQDTWVGRQMDEFYGSGQDITSILTKGDHRIEWFRYVEQNSDLLVNSEFFEGAIPERTIHLCKFSNGFLGAAATGVISDESWDLMKRATGVFSFAYTRFRDLQKAEESARRARQQASLDRVRADISSMRSSDDLNRITPLVWNELTTLGIPFIRCGVFIIHESEEQVEVYLSKPDGTSLAVMHLPFDSNELTLETVEAWRNKEVYTQHWTRKEFLEWGRSMMEQNQVADMKTYQGAEKAPESLHLHFIPFNQ